MLIDMVKVLAGSPLFANIAADALAAMLVCLQPRVGTYGKNKYITVEGEPFTGLGIMLSGEAAVIKENVAGARTILTTLQAGDMFGEMIAFSSQQTWPASVFTQSECTAVFLPPQKITGACAHACAGHQQMIKNMLRLVSERALLLNRKVEYLTIKSLRAKIATYLLEQYKRTGQTTFLLPLKRSDLADFLNASRTALSRELGRMRDAGLLDFYRSSVKLKDIAGLKKCLIQPV